MKKNYLIIIVLALLITGIDIYSQDDYDVEREFSEDVYEPEREDIEPKADEMSEDEEVPEDDFSLNYPSEDELEHIRRRKALRKTRTKNKKNAKRYNKSLR